MFPNTLYLELTNRCVYNCQFCAYSQMTREKADLETYVLQKLLREAGKYNIRGVVLSGIGEPMLTNRECYYLTSCKKQLPNGKITLETNGILLNRQRSRCLIEEGLDKIIFNISATKPKVYSDVYGYDGFFKVRDNIHALSRLRRSMKVDNPEIIVRFMATYKTLPDIKRYINYWEPRVDRVLLEVAHNWAGQLTRRQNPYRKTMVCSNLLNEAVILADGTVPLCRWDYDAKFSLGNVKHDKLVNIWSNPVRLRSLIRPKDNPLCSECKLIPNIPKRGDKQ